MSNPQTDVIVVASDELALSLFLNEPCLEQFRNKFPLVTIRESHFGIGPSESSGAIEYNMEGFSAAVVLLERAMLENERFLRFLEVVTSRASRQVDFRLLILFKDLSIEDLRGDGGEFSGVSRLHAIEQLFENIQVSGIRSVETIVSELEDYLSQLHEIRSNFRTTLKTLKHRSKLGQWIGWVRTGCPLLILFLILIFGSKDAKTFHELRDAIVSVPLIEFFVGFFAISTFVAPVHLIAFPRIERFRDKGFLIDLLFSITALFFISACVIHADFSNSIFGLGLILGLGVEVVYRRLFKAQIKLQTLSLSLAEKFDNDRVSSDVNAIERSVYLAAKQKSDNYRRCPLIASTDQDGSVFISYSRRSEWCEEHAKAIAADFSKSGVKTFLDRNSIPEGCCWRFQLYKSIHQQSLFIILLDEISASSQWAAAELEAALKSLNGVGAPQIVVVFRNENEKQWKRENVLPVFHAVCASFESGKRLSFGAPIVIPLEKNQGVEAFEYLKNTLAWLKMGLLGVHLSMIVYLLRIAISKICEGSMIVAPFIFGGLVFFYGRVGEFVANHVSNPLATLVPVFSALVFGYLLSMWFYMRKEIQSKVIQFHMISVSLAWLVVHAFWIQSLNLILLSYIGVFSVLGWFLFRLKYDSVEKSF